jgi:hypothetical protein
VADLTGSGNVEVVFVQGARAKALDLSSPSTGLMRVMHDGQGTHVTMRYERAAPSPGVGGRPPVLAEMTRTSSGQDPLSTQFEYAQPVMHTKGKFLVGYGTTRRISPLLMEEVTFHHDDVISGVVTGTLSTDARSNFYKFSTIDYEDADYLGVRKSWGKYDAFAKEVQNILWTPYPGAPWAGPDITPLPAPKLEIHR